MNRSQRTIRWTPRTVSWLSLAIMGLVVAGVGLSGTAYVVGYLHERMTAHGVEHNREIAQRLLPCWHRVLTLPKELSAVAPGCCDALRHLRLSHRLVG